MKTPESSNRPYASCRVLLLVISICWTWVGCHDEPSSPSPSQQAVETPSLRVGVAVVDEPRTGADGVAMRVTHPRMGEYSYRIGVEDGALGFVLEQGDRVAWRTSWKVQDGGASILITEGTQVDVLEILRTELVPDRLYREVYVLNDAPVWDVTFDPSSIPSQDDLDAFASMFPPGCTLWNNLEGELAVEIVARSNLRTWLESALPPAQRDARPMDANDRRNMQMVCTIANVAAYKCYLGGLANPICIPAMGVSLACTAYDVYCLFRPAACRS